MRIITVKLPELVDAELAIYEYDALRESLRKGGSRLCWQFDNWFNGQTGTRLKDGTLCVDAEKVDKFLRLMGIKQEE
jgi:hypothetical protein